MTLWKLGCRWGSGKPLFYNFMCRHNKVVGWHEKRYGIGDWLLLADGHNVIAFAQIRTRQRPITDFPNLEIECNSVELPFDDDIDIYEADIIQLHKDDVFLYETQHGIVRIRKQKIHTTFEKKLRKYMHNKDIRTLLEANHNIILHGAPGTGKTFTAKHLFDDTEQVKIRFVQFHPSYDYTDFVEGLRPTKPENGQMGFDRKDGVFKECCKEAINAPDDKFVFIIDEINRGDMSKIFGELFFSIDPGYRGEEGRVDTQYQNMIEDGDVFYNGFYVPENVYIVGTMNDIDRSVESMDFAMRRRFAFYEITAEDSKDMLNHDTFRNAGIGNISDATIDVIKQKMGALNNTIVSKEIGLSKDYQIGAAYFLKYALYATEEGAFMKLWNNHLLSVLTEYLRGTGDEEEKIKILEQAYNSSETNHD